MGWISTKDNLHKALDEAMEIIQGKVGPKTECDYETDARHTYPQRFSLLAEQIGKLRSLVNHLPDRGA